MKYVTARQFFGGWSNHLLATNNANVISILQFLWGGVGVPSVHVVYSSSGQDHIIKSFLKGSGRQVHGSNSKQWQGVNTDHNDDKESIKDHFEQADDKLCVQHEHCFVLPWIFTAKKKSKYKTINYFLLSLTCTNRCCEECT